jgi:hypothetical protein
VNEHLVLRWQVAFNAAFVIEGFQEQEGDLVEEVAGCLAGFWVFKAVGDGEDEQSINLIEHS